MLDWFRKGALVAGFALGAAAASASTVTLQEQAGGLFGEAGFAGVTVTVPGTGSQVARVGAFRVTDSTRNFLAWCVDAATTLKLPSQYSTTDTPFQNATTWSSNVVNNVQRLFDTAARQLNVNDVVQAAGFQVALWAIIYEDPANPLNVDSGDFRMTKGSQEVRDAANAFLAGLDGPATSRYDLTFWASATDHKGNRLSQNLLEATVIPLPAAVWMLLAALGTLFVAGKARRRVA